MSRGQEMPGRDLAEAVRMLRAVVEALPPRTPRDQATTRRLEGAAIVLKTLADASK